MFYFEKKSGLKNYDDAIRLCCDILQCNGHINGEYYDAILRNIEEYGGYFYLGEGICMPHASSSNGVLKTGICLFVPEEPIDFIGHPVRLFITLAADNSSTHQTMLKKIATVCRSEEERLSLLQAKTSGDVKKILGGDWK